MDTQKKLILEIASYIVGLETGGISYIGTPSAGIHKDNIVEVVREALAESVEGEVKSCKTCGVPTPRPGRLLGSCNVDRATTTACQEWQPIPPLKDETISNGDPTPPDNITPFNMVDYANATFREWLCGIAPPNEKEELK